MLHRPNAGQIYRKMKVLIAGALLQMKKGVRIPGGFFIMRNKVSYDKKSAEKHYAFLHDFFLQLFRYQYRLNAVWLKPDRNPMCVDANICTDRSILCIHHNDRDRPVRI